VPHDTQSGNVSDEQIRAILRRSARLTDQQIAWLPRRDRIDLARSLAQFNYEACAVRTLMFEIPTPDPLPFTRWSQIRAIALLALTVISLAVTCGLFGRIIL
jgi:hypothetical protein